MSRMPFRRRPIASRSRSVQEKSIQKKSTRKRSVRRKSTPKKFARAFPNRTPLFSANQRELITKRRGELAELAFTLKAASLGFGVSKPFGDSERYDVIVDSRQLSPRRKKQRKPALTTAHVAKGAKPVLSGVEVPVPREASGPETSPRMPAPTSPRALRNVRKLRGLLTVQGTTLNPCPAPNPPLWRVQVKCSTQLDNGLYHLNAHRRTGGRAVAYLPGEIHFLAAYIIPEDTWYIIPLEGFLGSTSLLFRRQNDLRPGRYDAYREAWHLLRPK